MDGLCQGKPAVCRAFIYTVERSQDRAGWRAAIEGLMRYT